MVWASFDHSTARPVGDNVPDPQKHAHVLVFNATRTRPKTGSRPASSPPSSGTASITPPSFYSRLARRLEDLGYAIDRRGGKEWEIAGVPQSVIDKFNKRTDEIEAEHRTGGCGRSRITGRSTSTSWGPRRGSTKQKELTPERAPRRRGTPSSPTSEREALAAVYRRDVHGRRRP